jgi:hypothetical protein
MERVGTLIDKLKKQFDEQQNAANLLGTVQLLLVELQDTQISKSTGKVSITMPSAIIAKAEQKIELPVVTEVVAPEKIAVKKEEKLGWLFDPITTVPTLAHQDMQEAKEVLEINEKLLTENHDLNDILKEDKTEVASFLQASPVKDLKKAIGINDRYLFINELFRGDEDMYERSIKTINGFSIYAEAEYWIQRELIVKIGWNENAENVQAFVQLVKRRFS